MPRMQGRRTTAVLTCHPRGPCHARHPLPGESVTSRPCAASVLGCWVLSTLGTQQLPRTAPASLRRRRQLGRTVTMRDSA